jgi:hypothetical protein
VAAYVVVLAVVVVRALDVVAAQARARGFAVDATKRRHSRVVRCLATELEAGCRIAVLGAEAAQDAARGSVRGLIEHDVRRGVGGYVPGVPVNDDIRRGLVRQHVERGIGYLRAVVSLRLIAGADVHLDRRFDGYTGVEELGRLQIEETGASCRGDRERQPSEA